MKYFLVTLLMIGSFTVGFADADDNKSKCLELRKLHKQFLSKVFDDNNRFTASEKNQYHELAEATLKESRTYCAAYASEYH